MKLKIFSSGSSGLFAIFADHAFDLVRMVADQAVDFDCLDYASFSPLDKSPDGYAEEVSSFFLGEEIGVKIHMSKLSRGIPIFLEIRRAIFFPKVLLPVK